MSDTTSPEPHPRPKPGRRRMECNLQGLALAVLCVIASGLLWKGDTAHAFDLGTGLVGALGLNAARKGGQ